MQVAKEMADFTASENSAVCLISKQVAAISGTVNRPVRPPLPPDVD